MAEAWTAETCTCGTFAVPLCEGCKARQGCPRCGKVHGSDAAVAVGRFQADGPEGYRSRLGGPLRATREEAVKDYCEQSSPTCWACPHPKAHHAPGGGCQEHINAEALCACCNEFPDDWQPIEVTS